MLRRWVTAAPPRSLHQHSQTMACQHGAQPGKTVDETTNRHRPVADSIARTGLDVHFNSLVHELTPGFGELGLVGEKSVASGNHSKAGSSTWVSILHRYESISTSHRWRSSEQRPPFRNIARRQSKMRFRIYEWVLQLLLSEDRSQFHQNTESFDTTNTLSTLNTVFVSSTKPAFHLINRSRPVHANSREEGGR